MCVCATSSKIPPDDGVTVTVGCGRCQWGCVTPCVAFFSQSFSNSHPFYISNCLTELQCGGCFSCPHLPPQKQSKALRGPSDWHSIAKRTSKFYHSRNQTFAHPYQLSRIDCELNPGMTSRYYRVMPSRYSNKYRRLTTHILSNWSQQWIRMTQVVYGLRSSQCLT